MGLRTITPRQTMTTPAAVRAAPLLLEELLRQLRVVRSGGQRVRVGLGLGRRARLGRLGDRHRPIQGGTRKPGPEVKQLTAPPGSACLTPPAHVGGGNVKWPSRRFSGSTDIDGALCWGIYGVSPTGKHTQDARWWEYDT